MKNRKREICTSGSVRDEDGQPPHLLGRRKFLHLAAGAAALPTVSRVARAQAYPTRPVRIIAGFPGGSASDTTARLIGQWLSERLGQPFVMENRPGAASNLAAEAVVHAPPDGYTLLLVTSVNAINANLGFDFIRDIVPVARRAFERLRQASNVFWSKPMIVLEKHSDGHEKLKLAHGGTSAQSIGMNNALAS